MDREEDLARIIQELGDRAFEFPVERQQVRRFGRAAESPVEVAQVDERALRLRMQLALVERLEDAADLDELGERGLLAGTEPRYVGREPHPPRLVHQRLTF